MPTPHKTSQGGFKSRTFLAVRQRIGCVNRQLQERYHDMWSVFYKACWLTFWVIPLYVWFLSIKYKLGGHLSSRRHHLTCYSPAGSTTKCSCPRCRSTGNRWKQVAWISPKFSFRWYLVLVAQQPHSDNKTPKFQLCTQRETLHILKPTLYYMWV